MHATRNTCTHSVSELQLKVVYTALIKVKDQWFNLGLQLDINPHDLRGIEANYNNDTERLREMINLRLNQGSGMTWENIAAALENPTISQRALAREIRKTYIHVLKESTNYCATARG